MVLENCQLQRKRPTLISDQKEQITVEQFFNNIAFLSKNPALYRLTTQLPYTLLTLFHVNLQSHPHKSFNPEIENIQR